MAHETKGVASIYQLPEGKKLLRFGGFETSSGPDVQSIWWRPRRKDNDTVTKAGFSASAISRATWVTRTTNCRQK